ncbi:MAG: DUF1761 domain-containing protein [Cellvibrionaceae bacterium]
MDISQINIFAILIATISSFFLGGLWYSKLLFGKIWMQEAGLSEETVQKANMLKTFSLAILANLVITFNLAMFLGPDSTLVTGVFYGFLAGFGWVAMAFAINDAFEQRSFKLFAINAGYQTLSFSISGGIIGAWH